MNNYCQSTITLKYMNKTLINNIEGDVVELGCFEGDTLFLMRYLLDSYKSDKKLMVMTLLLVYQNLVVKINTILKNTLTFQCN